MPAMDPVPSETVLSVDDLSIAFRSEGRWLEVVRGASFDILPRQTLAIVGESGSGKSVTSLAIMRLLPRQTSRVSGNITLCGRNLLALPEAQMRKVRGRDVSMIYQEPMTSLNPMFTVGDQINEAVRTHSPEYSGSEVKAASLALMDKVRIPSAKARFHEHPHQFSGGMRQRVMIAIALASRPKLLIADEPTTALDVTIQGQVLDLIKELQAEEGMSVLFITHDMGVVAEMADRTMVMYRGETVERGTTERVFHASTAPYTRALLASVPTLGAMKGVAFPTPFPKVDMDTGAVSPPPPAVDTVERQSAPILELRNLTTRFDIRAGTLRRLTGRVHAVEDVSFSIRPGETLSLVGESGCGKSTIGKSILQLATPTSGEILFEGRRISSSDKEGLRKLRRGAQMIFQDPFGSLNPRMRIGAAIAEPYLAHGLGNRAEARARVADLLDQVGLDSAVADRFPHEFSGGQRQRICIARALALEPKLIVADESVSALDVSIQAQVVNLMLDLQKRLGLAYLFISHDMAVVERVSHRIAVMYLGEIVEIGPREAVLSAPRHPYSRKLINAVPVPDPARRHTRRDLPDEEILTPVRPLDHLFQKREFIEVGPDHFVQAGNV
ncbi:dipeptide ABC transporter ATP-binding protein [Rhodobacteraceae bacterium 2CG4]|uniref:Glutathione import ATP-binding protein GsiA n=2 Tax=Halovulum marinum TaxID=2662447 RepID=A0A6L5Z657_9RHOB|nr:dipeptide ABC transporter ATP-binding protein [Halovulum marinum]